MFNLAEISGALTMSSLELVEFINSERLREAEAAGAEFPSKGFAKLEHADFMKKVLEVLGVNAGKFSGIYFDTRNREQDCYNFPKREACLMAMSYSYDIQAKVFDRWQELEITLNEQAKELALREGYGVNAVNFDLIKVIGKEAALFTELTRDALLRAEEDFKKLNLPPYKSQKYLNDIYNHALKRVYVRVKQEETHQRNLEVQQREIEAHNHKVWMAERKGLLNKSKHEAAEEALRLKMEKRHQLELNHLRLTS